MYRSSVNFWSLLLCFIGTVFFYCHKMLMSTVFLGGVNDTEMQEHYDEFFEEVFTELEDKVYTAVVVHHSRQRSATHIVCP